MDHEPEALRITIAVLTFQRPSDLPEALDALVTHIAASSVPASVLVVDNDATPTARAIVESYSGAGVRYVHEPVPGIAAARNRALAESVGDSVLIFVDDDERPEPGWLDALVTTWRHHACAAAAGPVVSRYSGDLDPWIEAGGFFVRRRHPTGTHVPVAATNNLLLDLAFVRRAGIRFDERFGISGGSDTMFTRELVAAGGTIVWCDEAVVVDVVPTQRLTRDWVLRRALRMGNSLSRTTVAVQRTRRALFFARVRLTAGGVARIAYGGTRSAWGRATHSLRHDAKGRRTMARGRGMLTGAWGRVVEEYRRSSTTASATP